MVGDRNWISFPLMGLVSSPGGTPGNSWWECASWFSES